MNGDPGPGYHSTISYGIDNRAAPGLALLKVAWKDRGTGNELISAFIFHEGEHFNHENFVIKLALRMFELIVRTHKFSGQRL